MQSLLGFPAVLHSTNLCEMTKKEIVIVGGGTAGWIAANLLNASLKQDHNITLIESPNIPTIGVGEGSTPHLVQLFRTLGIAENEWMPRCFATYKNGIAFERWSSSHRADSYFHPFSSGIDQNTAPAFLAMSEENRKGAGPWINPSEYFLTGALARLGKSPKTKPNAVHTPLNYGYHFDAAELATILKNNAKKQGVKHITDNVIRVTRNDDGDIASVVLSALAKINADFFIDCTGFHGLLIKQALAVPYVSYKKHLLNDSAIACGSTQSSTFATQTTSIAQDFGWTWHIPLQNRVGNGYVYSSEYADAKAIEQNLLQELGSAATGFTPRKIGFQPGRLEANWVQNCLSVGLSQGFIEPLEATALHLVQESVEKFISAYQAGNQTSQHREQYNQLISQRFDGIRDYILAHYLCSNRSDTEYWRYYQTLNDIPAPLANILDIWRQGGDIIKYIISNGLQAYYSPISWYCLLMGYDYYTTSGDYDNSHLAYQQRNAISQKITQWAQRFV